MNELGMKIRKFRQDNQLDINDLAKKIEISTSYLYGIENGYTIPSAKVLHKICNAIELDSSQIINFKSDYYLNPIVKMIKNERIKNNLTLIELSKRTGICISQLSSIENSSIEPSKKALKKICDVLQIDYLELINLDNTSNLNASRTLSTKLKNARKTKALYQKEVAKKAGIYSSFYSNIENGWQLPSKEALRKICKVLDLDFEEMSKLLEEAKTLFANFQFANKLSTTIKKARENKKLTQLELAKQLQISSPILSNIEHGKKIPSREFLKKLCDALELNFDEMLILINKEK